MKVAPLGAFGAMSFTIGKYGLGSLASPGQLMLAFYTTCLLFVFFILGSVMKLAGYNLWRLLKFIREEILIVLGIDRFMSEARAITNLIGNAVATVVVAKWEKEIDPEISRKLIG